jgi:hypothetical protein
VVLTNGDNRAQVLATLTNGATGLNAVLYG